MPRALLLQALLVAALGAVVGLGANASSPRPVPLRQPVHAKAETTCEGVPRIEVAEALALCDGCRAVFVDARAPDAYAAGHVIGAVHLPPAGHPDAARVLAVLRAAPLVIVYDADASCTLADEVAARLMGEGIARVRVLSGAWPGWEAAKGPGVSGACGECTQDGADGAGAESQP